MNDRFAPELAGGRIAFPVSNRRSGFLWADAFLGCSLPCDWQINDRYTLHTRMDFEAGWLSRNGNDAATAGAGPVFVLTRRGLPISLEGGSSSTLISRHDFGDVHLGSPYQFNTHIGLNWRFAERFRLTYRFEHMSNGGIARPNPGLNLQAIALAYLF